MILSQHGKVGRAHFSCRLSIHHEQLWVLEEGDGLLAFLDPGEVLLLNTGGITGKV